MVTDRKHTLVGLQSLDAYFGKHLEVQVKLQFKSFHSSCSDSVPFLLCQDSEFEPESFNSTVVCEKPNNNLNHFKCYV